MSETSDLLAVVGELDRELVRLHDQDPDAGDEARSAAATLIPALDDPRTLGWYDRFLEHTHMEVEDTDLDTALRALAAPTDSLAIVARRLAAIGAVTRALAEFQPRNERAHAVQVALSGPGILRDAPSVGDPTSAPEAPQEGAAELHERLMDRTALPHVRNLREFLVGDEQIGIVHLALADAPLPCASVLVPVVSSGVDIALAVITDVCVAGTTFAQATSDRSLLNPVTWTQSDFWCELTAAPGQQNTPWYGRRRFLERVALDCDAGDAGFPVAVWLDFSALVVDVEAGVAVREYSMAVDQPQPANDAVSVDEGVLIVRRDDGHVRITTTKRVEFTVGVEEAALAVLTCALGYGALAAEFALGGLGTGASELACEGAGLLALPPEGRASFDPVDEPLTALAQTADECGEAAVEALRRAAAGDVTLAGLAHDLAQSFRRSVTATLQLGALATVIADPPRVLQRLEAGPFAFVPPAGTLPVGPCRLEMSQTLTSLRGNSVAPERIGFAGGGKELGRQDRLDPGSDPFTLRVPTEGVPAGWYRGQVRLVEDNVVADRTVAVDVLIP